MADKQHIEYEVETDATDSVKSVNAVAKELASVVSNMAAMETKLRGILTGQIPQKTKELAGYLERISTAANLPPNLGGVNRAARNLSSGGPQTTFTQAAMRGVVNTLKTDPAYLAVTYEKEAAKVAEARLTLYRRMREALPSDANQKTIATAWAKVLDSMGGAPDVHNRGARRAWMEQTRAEAVQLERRITADTLAETRKRLEAEQQLYDRYARNAATRLARTPDAGIRDVQSAAVVSKLQNFAGRRASPDFKLDTGRLRDVMDAEVERIQATSVPKVSGRSASLERQLQIIRGQVANTELTDVEALEKAIAAEREALSLAKANSRKARTASENIARLERELAIERGDVSKEELTRAEALRKEISETRKANKAAAAPSRQERTASRVQAANDMINYQGGSFVFGLQARYMANSTALNSVLGTLRYAVTSTIAFQTSLKDLQAITGATNVEMTRLTKTIVDVGVKSKYSLADVAEGAKILAQAGYSAGQIDKVLQPILNYAAATGTNVKDAVETTTSVLNQFDMSLERTGEITNIMTAGLNKSKLNSEQLALGLQYAGNQAAVSNVTFEETVAALGSMANAGIRSGSTLGTGLRAVLAEFDNPSKKFRAQLEGMGLTLDDVNLKSHSLSEVIRTLTNAGFTYADALGSFDRRSAAAFSAMQNNLGLMEQMQKSIVGTEMATDAANTQMDTYTAQWTRLQNSLTGIVSSAGGPVLDLLKNLFSGTADLIHALEPAAPLLSAVGTGFAALAAAATVKWLLSLAAGLFTTDGLLKLIGADALVAAAGVGEAGAVAGAASIGFAELSAAMLASPMVIFAAAIAACVAAFQIYNYVQESAKRKTEEYVSAANAAGAEAEKYGARMGEVEKTINQLTDRHASLTENTHAAAQAAENATARFGAWGLEMDKEAGKVNGLINGLIQLKAKMAEVRVEKLREQREDLLSANKELGKQRGGLSGANVGLRASNVLGAVNTRALSPELVGVLKSLSKNNGEVDLTTLQKYKTIVDQGVKSTNQIGSQKPLKALQESLEASMRLAGQINENALSISNIDQQMIQPQIESRSSGLLKNVTGQQGAFNDREREISKLKGQEKRDAQLKLDADRKAAASSFLSKDLPAATKNFLADPTMGSQLRNAAAAAGLTPEEFVANNLKDNQQLNQFLAKGGQWGAIDNVDTLTSGKQLLNKRYRAGKIGKAEYMAQIHDIDSRLIAVQHPDWSAADQELELSNQDGIADLNHTGGGAGRTARQGGKTAASMAKALQTRIENVAASLGPTPDDMLKGQDKLAALLAQWKDAREKQVRAEATGASAGDLAQRLKDLDVETEQFSSKILNGNISAAKALMAKAADLAATQAQTKAITNITTAGGALETNLKDVNEKFVALMKANLDAETAKFKAANPGADPSTSAELQSQLADITRQGTQKIIEASMSVIEAFFEKAEKNIELEMRRDAAEFADRRVVGKQLGNSFGRRNRSDVHRQYQAILDERTDRDEAQRNVTRSQEKYNNATAEVGAIQSQYDAAPAGEEKDKLAQQLEAAKQKAEAFRAALDDAKRSFEELTGEAPSFKNVTDALDAAWTVFQDKIGMTKPMTEQVADGFEHVFDTAHDSLTTFLTQLNEGSKNTTKNFATMVKAILQSMEQMAIKMAADKLLKWAFTAIRSFLPGGGGTTMESAGASQQSLIQGGRVRMAGGGKVPRLGNPDRDSVNVYAQPGEIMMNKSAVSMIGEDTLLALNAAGNRRMSEVRPLSEALPKREPDNTNVWVVPPGTKPTMGKKDVVAAITEDILANGQTKKLIKSIQTGGV